MLTEKASLKQTQAQTQPQPQPQLQQAPTIVMVPTAVATSLPFNVQTDLNLYKKISIVKQYDYFRILHCCQNLIPDYIVYGEMPDGDKKILFTSSPHFECCRCCDEFTVWLGLCAYVCCDKILFQMDYKRNGVAFYTQGINMQKGCYCCKCACCSCCYFCCCCCPLNTLYLRENVDPESPDFNVGVKKGKTEVPWYICCETCRDKTASYTSQEGINGPTIRAKCCDIRKHVCLRKCCCGATCDFEIDIEDGNGLKNGSIFIYSGCCSKKTEGKCCFCPLPYYDIEMPASATSEQKFQIIADTIHFDIINGVL
jgi:hypothetical protein